MLHIARRMTSLLLVCALVFTTACQNSVPPASSGEVESPSPSVSVPTEGVAEPLPTDEEPEPVVEVLAAPKSVLTREDIDQALEEVMSQYSAAAVSVATIENGELSQSGAWGWAVKDEREMTADTKVRVASLSKVIIGMCAMAMAEDGILDLDAPLSQYWGKEITNPYSKGQPSVRTLMTHTSSIKALDTTRGLAKLRGLLEDNTSWRSMEPGNGGYWYYSNFGFCVLGTTLELAADQILDDYLQAKFLRPMGAQASFHAAKLEREALANIYTTGGVGRSISQQVERSVPTKIGEGASFYPGGFTVSAVDLAKLVAVLAGDGTYDGVQYLTPESVSAMETPYFTVDPGEAFDFQQCLVLRRQENILGRSSLYYHTGSAYGVFSLLTYDPETGDGVVVITTGTPRKTGDHGLYALCADLSANLYARMENAA